MFPLSCVLAESNTHGGCEWGLSRRAFIHDPYLGGTFTSNERGQRQSSARRFGSSIAAREKERRNGRCLELLNRERLIEHEVLYWEYIRNKDQIVHRLSAVVLLPLTEGGVPTCCRSLETNNRRVIRLSLHRKDVRQQW